MKLALWLLIFSMTAMGLAAMLVMYTDPARAQAPPPPERKKPKHLRQLEAIQDARRKYALMRMQPEYHRWNFTNWQPIGLNNGRFINLRGTQPPRVRDLQAIRQVDRGW